MDVCVIGTEKNYYQGWKMDIVDSLRALQGGELQKGVMLKINYLPKGWCMLKMRACFGLRPSINLFRETKVQYSDVSFLVLCMNSKSPRELFEVLS